MGGIVIDIWEKSNFLGQLDHKKVPKMQFFFRGGRICPLPLVGLTDTNTNILSVSNTNAFNPIRAGGLNQPALFSDGYFSMKKGVWRSQIS